MIKSYKAKINFTITKNHPSYNYEKNTNKVFSFEDTYNINTEYFDDNIHIKNYISNDLKLVAGGGYNTENISNVKISINLA